MRWGVSEGAGTAYIIHLVHGIAAASAACSCGGWRRGANNNRLIRGPGLYTGGYMSQCAHTGGKEEMFWGGLGR
jgi:hypothetical protein